MFPWEESLSVVGFAIWGLRFGVWGLRFGVWGLGFGVWGLDACRGRKPRV
jgi:hypothetical protein